jgi:hypothetical protein
MMSSSKFKFITFFNTAGIDISFPPIFLATSRQFPVDVFPANVGLAAANMEHVANTLGLGLFYAGSATGISINDFRIKEFLGIRKNQRLMHLIPCMRGQK